MGSLHYQAIIFLAIPPLGQIKLMKKKPSPIIQKNPQNLLKPGGLKLAKETGIQQLLEEE